MNTVRVLSLLLVVPIILGWQPASSAPGVAAYVDDNVAAVGMFLHGAPAFVPLPNGVRADSHPNVFAPAVAPNEWPNGTNAGVLDPGGGLAPVVFWEASTNHAVTPHGEAPGPGLGANLSINAIPGGALNITRGKVSVATHVGPGIRHDDGLLSILRVRSRGRGVVGFLGITVAIHVPTCLNVRIPPGFGVESATRYSEINDSVDAVAVVVAAPKANARAAMAVSDLMTKDIVAASIVSGSPQKPGAILMTFAKDSFKQRPGVGVVATATASLSATGIRRILGSPAFFELELTDGLRTSTLGPPPIQGDAVSSAAAEESSIRYLAIVLLSALLVILWFTAKRATPHE